MNVSFPKCNQAGTEFVISTTDDLQEKVNYLSEDFPVAIFTQTYHHAASDSTPFHWHNELQLNWVSEGELEYCINGDSLRLSGDKILLVKDHQLHSSRTTGKDTCSLCINFSPDIFHPMILKPAKNSGIFKTVLVTHKGRFQSSFPIMAIPETPPVTILAGSKIFLVARPMRMVPMVMAP